MSVEHFIADTFGADSLSSTNVAADCISCGKERHLYINTQNGLAYCFRCGYSANLYKLVRDLKGTSRFETMRLIQEIKKGSGKPRRAALKSPAGKTHEDVARWLDGLREIMLHEDQKVQAAPLALPAQCVPAGAVDYAREYLRDRKLRRAFWEPYGVLACVDQKSHWFAHLIIPSYDQSGALRYFTSRRCDNITMDGGKSYHPKNASHRGVLFGEHALITKRSVILVEGPLDMLSLSGRAVCLLGKRLAREDAQIIAERFTQITVALDSDARDFALRHCKLLSGLGARRVRVVRDLSGDPNDWIKTTPEATARYALAHSEAYSDATYLAGVIST